MSVITREEIPQARAAVSHSVKQQRGRKKRTPAEIVISNMVREGLLPFGCRMSLPEAVVLDAFFADLHSGWGVSGALSPIDYNRSGGGGGKGFLPPGIPTKEHERAGRVLSIMRPFEVEIVRWIEKSRSRPAGKATLTAFGREVGNGTEDDFGAAQQGAGIMQMFSRAILATGVYDPAQYRCHKVPRDMAA